jgi:hypothetical protein
MREDDDPTVEGGHRHLHAERLNQHPHATRRPLVTAKSTPRSCNASPPESLAGSTPCLGNQRAVHVREHRGNFCIAGQWHLPFRLILSGHRHATE